MHNVTRFLDTGQLHTDNTWTVYNKKIPCNKI